MSETSPTRRDVLATTAAAGFSLLSQRAPEAAAGNDAIRPFLINIQEEKLVDFLDWTHDHLKALDKTLLQVTRAVTQDQQSLGGMVDILLEDAKKVLMLPFASALEVLPKMVRDLSRTRKQLTREIIQHTNRIQKTLEDANIKLASAISNVLGKSGRAILEAIIEIWPAKNLGVADRGIREGILRSLMARDGWKL